jgi:hypothetical protein
VQDRVISIATTDFTAPTTRKYATADTEVVAGEGDDDDG